jgi:predicted DNA-binding ribbon-helix-helix protein
MMGALFMTLIKSAREFPSPIYVTAGWVSQIALTPRIFQKAPYTTPARSQLTPRANRRNPERVKNKKPPPPPWTTALAAVADCKRGLILYNVRIAGRRTSCRLDAATWSALGDVAGRRGVTVNDLCTSIAATKPRALSLTAAIRCYLLSYFRRCAGRSRTVH